MKIIKLYILILAAAALILPVVITSAVDAPVCTSLNPNIPVGCCPSNNVTRCVGNPLGDSTTVEAVIAKIAGNLYVFAIPISALFMLWGGFQIMTSGGEAEKIGKGRKTIIYSIIGLLLIVFASGIGYIITNLLGGTNLAPNQSQEQAGSGQPTGSGSGGSSTGGGSSGGSSSPCPLGQHPRYQYWGRMTCVNDAPAAPTSSLSTNSSSVTQGESLTLSWSSTNTTSCAADASPSQSDWSGALPSTSGSRTVSPNASSVTYRMDCSGSNGTVTSTSVDVTVASGSGCNSDYIFHAADDIMSVNYCESRSYPQPLDQSGCPSGDTYNDRYLKCLHPAS